MTSGTRTLVATLLAGATMCAGFAGANAQSGSALSPEAVAELVAEGASIYRYRCSKCHGATGAGQQQGNDAAPRLTGNHTNLSVQKIASQVLRGGSYMPPFYDLSDRDVAAVATFIRSSFGNDLGAVTAEEIAVIRQGQ